MHAERESGREQGHGDDDEHSAAPAMRFTRRKRSRAAAPSRSQTVALVRHAQCPEWNLVANSTVSLGGRPRSVSTHNADRGTVELDGAVRHEEVHRNLTPDLRRGCSRAELAGPRPLDGRVRRHALEDEPDFFERRAAPLEELLRSDFAAKADGLIETSTAGVACEHPKTDFGKAGMQHLHTLRLPESPTCA